MNPDLHQFTQPPRHPPDPRIWDLETVQQTSNLDIAPWALPEDLYQVLRQRLHHPVKAAKRSRKHSS